MNEKFIELRKQYYYSVLSVSPEMLYSILPSPSFTNFLDIMKGVIESLDEEIMYYFNELRSTLDEEDKQLYINELNDIQKKRKICEKILSDSYTISTEEKVDETKKINIIFGVTPSGSIAFLNDLKRNIDEHYYEEIIELLDQLENGELVNNQEKVRRFNSNNSKLSGLMELKGFQIRLLFRQLPKNIIYIDMVRIKKDDRVTKDFQEPIRRMTLLTQDFESKKRRIKNNDKVDELIIEGEEMMATVRRFLEESLKKRRGKNGE
ncbi:MAG: hypothetical protein ACI4XM_05810 [Candidatus Coprovivens sp.]